VSASDREWRAFAVGVGTNVGDRAAQVEMAVRLLGTDEAIRHLHVAPAITTDPVVPGGHADEHPEYLNTAIIGETTRSPEVLMSRLLTVEATCGRRRRGTVDPRTLDLDLLVYEGESVCRDGLEIPHPRLSGRRFVLDPLVVLLNRLERGDGASESSPTSMSAGRRLRAAAHGALKAAGVADSELH
jgi:2-amino-4-hydroxy-6-hydroxymethyldihydropteridine diphosphokinase